jgi:hypothetical protein
MNNRLILVGMAAVFGLITVCNPPEKRANKTDGVYESAIEKIDNNESHLLNKRETERLEDILNFCNECQEGYRTCKHGPNR